MIHQKYRLIAAGIILFHIGHAQEVSLKKKDVPNVVLDAFQKTFPQATVKGYSKETEQGTVTYEIESIERKVHRDISYAANGSTISIEETFPYKDVPDAVHTVVAKNFPRSKILSCEKVSKGSLTQYELLIRSGKEKKELVFNADGTFEEKEEK